MVADGARLVGVQVLSGSASSSTGLADLTEPGVANPDDKWDRSTASDRDVIAVVGYLRGRNPVVTGFLFPQVSQVLFARPNFHVNRHPSDWYQTVDDKANVEWSHPSGTFLRFAEDPEHEDLTGLDFDKEWAIARNTGRAPWVSLMLKNAGVEKARLRISPAGAVTLTHVGPATITSGGNVSWNVAGTFSLTATGAVSISSSGGNVSLSANNQLGFTAASLAGLIGGGTGSASMQGNFAFTGTLTSNGKSISDSHTHTGVTPGGGTSGTVS